MTSLLKKPSAWAPLLLSVLMIIFFLGNVAFFGVPAPEPDEGIAAHLFQIWLALEVCMITFFALKWLPQTPKQALYVLIAQICAALIVLAPVFILKL